MTRPAAPACHVHLCPGIACYGATRPGGIRLARDGDVVVWSCRQHRQDGENLAAEIMDYRDEPRIMRAAMPEPPRQGVLL